MRLLILFLILLSACGRAGTGIKVQMEPIYAAASYLAIDKLQEASHNIEVGYNATDPRILIEYATDEALEKQYGKPVLGLATIRWGSPCRIQISHRTFQWGQDWLDAVMWHEIGHCLGMEHTEDATDLMYQYAKPFSWYTKDAIDRFLRRLYEETN